jgi:DNA-binding SARP family transcriptional activator
MNNRRTGSPRANLDLMGGFRLEVSGVHTAMPPNAERLLAFLALRASGVTRSAVTAALWPDVPQQHAAGRLRSTLWRIARVWPTGVAQDGRSLLRLGDAVDVDVARIEREVDVLCGTDGSTGVGDLDITELQADLLPTWPDEWLVGEREWLRQVRLHALDALCAHHRVRGSFHSALRAGLAAVSTEPLRESAHRELVALHLAEGNPAEALRQYSLFRTLLHGELGVRPSAALEHLVAPLLNRLGGAGAG